MISSLFRLDEYQAQIRENKAQELINSEVEQLNKASQDINKIFEREAAKVKESEIMSKPKRPSELVKEWNKDITEFFYSIS